MKLKKIVITIVTVLTVILVILSGILKLLSADDVMATLDKVGVLPYRVLLGVMEISFALLFVFRPTMKLGFILLTCYFSGALAVELSHGMPFSALLPLLLVWITAYLRDRSIFLLHASPTAVAR